METVGQVATDVKLKTEQAHRSRTGTPDKYPQGKFNPKPCRKCGTEFSPNAPSQLYCSTDCAAEAQQDAYYKRNYGIEVGDWNTLYEKQGGKCYICEGEGFLMKEEHQAKLMVDHCHTTGKVRGLLCHNCNRALGLLGDNTDRLKKAIQYLEK